MIPYNFTQSCMTDQLFNQYLIIKNVQIMILMTMYLFDKVGFQKLMNECLISKRKNYSKLTLISSKSSSRQADERKHLN